MPRLNKTNKRRLEQLEARIDLLRRAHALPYDLTPHEFSDRLGISRDAGYHLGMQIAYRWKKHYHRKRTPRERYLKQTRTWINRRLEENPNHNYTTLGRLMHVTPGQMKKLCQEMKFSLESDEQAPASWQKNGDLVAEEQGNQQ